MGARGFLVLGGLLLLSTWAASGLGSVRRAPALVRRILDVLVILAAVRIGISVAIIAFDLSPASYAIPIAFGLIAAATSLGRARRQP
jgi:hypothetical protein